MQLDVFWMVVAILAIVMTNFVVNVVAFWWLATVKKHTTLTAKRPQGHPIHGPAR